MAELRAGYLGTSIERRAHRSWAEDGLPDIFFGLFAATASLLWYAEPRVPPRFVWLAPLMAVAFAIVAWLVGKALFAAKGRVSDARTGFVRPRAWRPSGRYWLWIVGASLLYGLVSGVVEAAFGDRLLSLAPIWERCWPVPLAAVTAAAVLGSCVLGFGPRRHLWVAALSLVGALIGPSLAWQPADSLALAYAIQAAALVGFGLVAFGCFLRQHPRPSAA